MSINVKNSTNKANQASSGKTGASAKSGKGSGSAKAPPKQQANEDSVSLTDAAGRLQQIEQSLNEIPIVDSARVDNISQSIDDGQYQINDDKIADRIIKSESAIHQLKKTS